MEEKDIFKYNLKRSEKVETLPTKTSVKLRSKGESSKIYYLKGQILANNCHISFNDCKGHEL